MGRSQRGFCLVPTHLHLHTHVHTRIYQPTTTHKQVFFVPGSGAKNGIVISLIDAIGLWPTFLLCLLSLYLWMKVGATFGPPATHTLYCRTSSLAFSCLLLLHTHIHIYTRSGVRPLLQAALAPPARRGQRGKATQQGGSLWGGAAAHGHGRLGNGATEYVSV